QNYGFLPIPVITALFSEETLGFLFVHNIGAEIAVWTIAVALLTGLSKAPWKRVLNPPLGAVALGLGLNLAGFGPAIPEALLTSIRQVGSCTIPIMLLVIGSTLYGVVREDGFRPHWKVLIGANLLRFALLPWLFFGAAAWLPVAVETKKILLVQGSMPAAVSTILLARLYGGHSLTVVQIALSTTVLGIFIIPLLVLVGLRIIGPLG
ncbi:MAG: AEC family transporter, partial [Verrucomicrobiota bacterium]